jgi:hypothetical protein
MIPSLNDIGNKGLRDTMDDLNTGEPLLYCIVAQGIGRRKEFDGQNLITVDSILLCLPEFAGWHLEGAKSWQNIGRDLFRDVLLEQE